MPKRTTSGTGTGGARMRDVARRAGVSTMTVSRALKEPGKVSEEMRERVLRAVRETGYLPNHMAGNLSSNRSTTIGLIVPSIDNSIYTQTVQGLSEVLKHAGFQLMIAETGHDPDEEEEIINAFLSHRVAGLVLHSADHTRAALDTLGKAGIPVVETGNMPNQPVDMVVSYSNHDAAFAMTMHLGRLGYKRIAFASLHSAHNDRSKDRIRGYLDALETLGLEHDPRLIVESERGLGAGVEVVQRVVHADPEVDALFCAGDVLAVGALFECQRRGWKVPDRLAIASFDDVDLLRHVSPAITTLRLPRNQIGERAARMLLSRIIDEDEHLQGSVVDLKFEVIQRDST